MRASSAICLLLGLAATSALGGERVIRWPSADQPAYPTSPYHGALNGDGQVIPCRCRFRGRDYRLGELACMATPSGEMLVRCDLMLNNTSWVPTTTPCTLSLLPRQLGGRRIAAVAGRALQRCVPG